MPAHRRDQGQAAHGRRLSSAPTTCSTSSASRSAPPASSARCCRHDTPPARPGRLGRRHGVAGRRRPPASGGMTGSSAAAGVAGRPEPAPASRPPSPHRPGPPSRAPARRTTGAQPPMPKSYRRPPPRGPRSQIREVTAAGGAKPSARPRATIVDVREASEWEQGHIPGADPRLARATSSSRSRPPAPIATSRSSCTARAASGRCSRPRRSRRWATPTWPAWRAASSPGRARGCEWKQPVVLTPGAEAPLQPPPAHPRGRVRGPGEAARLEGAADRGRRARLAGGAVPRRGGRRDHRHRRLRRRRRLATSSARSSTRPIASGERKVESAPKSRSTRSTPTSRSSPTRRCSSATTSSGSSTATT